MKSKTTQKNSNKRFHDNSTSLPNNKRHKVDSDNIIAKIEAAQKSGKKDIEQETTQGKKRPRNEDQDILDKQPARKSRRSLGFAPEVEMQANPDPKKGGSGGGNFGRTGKAKGKHAATKKSQEGHIPLSPIKNNPNSRPIAKFGEDSPTKGHPPRTVLSPGGTELKRVSNNGAIAYYEEKKPTQKNLEKVKRQLVFNTTELEEYEIKKSAITVTPETLKKAQEQIARNSGRRIKSQKEVMGESAKDHVTANAKTEWEWIDLNEKFEWLHEIMHAILANAAQVASNLVAGTFHANTEMLILVEKHIAKLVKEHKSVDLEVTSYMQPKTEIAVKIEYVIKVQGKGELLFTFNAQEKNRPASPMEKYAAKIFRDVGKVDKTAIDNTQPPVIKDLTNLAHSDRITKERSGKENLSAKEQLSNNTHKRTERTWVDKENQNTKVQRTDNADQSYASRISARRSSTKFTPGLIS